MELMDGQAFEAWHEGTINFAPTYKYHPTSGEYYGCGHLGTKSKKKRAPAWYFFSLILCNIDFSIRAKKRKKRNRSQIS